MADIDGGMVKSVLFNFMLRVNEDKNGLSSCQNPDNKNTEIS